MTGALKTDENSIQTKLRNENTKSIRRTSHKLQF